MSQLVVRGISDVQPERIKKGFHRVGIVLSVVPAALSAIWLAACAYAYVAELPGPIGPQVFIGIVFALAAVAAYVASRALGWIIAAFAGD